MSGNDALPFRSMDDEQPKGFQVVLGVANTYRALGNPFLQRVEAKRILSVVASDPELVRTWIDVFNDLGDDELFKRSEVLSEFVDDMHVELNTRINSLDDISRAACMNYAAEMWLAFDDLNPDVLIKPILIGPGKLLHVSGVMGSGKTDFGCLLSEICLSRGKQVITNVKFIDGQPLPPGLTRCVRMSELLLKMIDARISGAEIVVLFDETSEFFSRRDSATKGNIQLEKLLRLTRKFNTSLIFVEQIRGGLPSVALEMLTSSFDKVGRKKVHYATRLMERNYNLYLDSVPRTALPFDTKHPGGFIVDLDLGELFRDVLIEENTNEALRSKVMAAAGLNIPTIVRKKRTRRARPRPPG